MSKKAANDDKQLLQKFITALANLNDLTLELMDKQFVFVRTLGYLILKYQESAKNASFWKNAVSGLEPEDVANLFLYLGKVAELGNELAKFGTLKQNEQDKLFKDYQETTKALDSLRDKMNRT